MAATRSISDLPGPRGLPLVGNAHQIRPTNLHLKAEEWCEQYGPVYRFDLGPRRVVVLGDAGPINEVLRDRPDGFRRWSEIKRTAEEMSGTVGVFAAEGEDWIWGGALTRPGMSAGMPHAALRSERWRRLRSISRSNFIGCRVQGVKRGSCRTSLERLAAPHAVVTAAVKPASRTMRTCSLP